MWLPLGTRCAAELGVLRINKISLVIIRSLIFKRSKRQAELFKWFFLIGLVDYLLCNFFLLQDCMDEHKDWRKCQEHVKAFKACIDGQNKQKKT